ncbi:MAG: aminotransferase class I/II-fold pyridoxal phosphate-dependent enzyme [Bacteroidia bacterium]
MSITQHEQNMILAEQNFRRAKREGLAHVSVDPIPQNGRTIRIDGKELLHFGNCSYLGLDQDPDLKAAVVEAVGRFGTQYSSSRAYSGLGLYDELEDRLSTLFGSPTLVSASTTLGHLSALPVLVHDGDAVLLDHQVHASVNMATQLLKARGIHVEMVRHNHLGMLENRIVKLQSRYRRIWYLADGVYSMYGDMAPLHGLVALLDRYESLHLYIDDAHGTGWTGPRGSGYVRTWIPEHPRVFITASLNKSFAAGGGALIFPDRASWQQVRDLGGTLIFGGPLQPPMLGAAIASAQLHLSDRLPAMQDALLQRIRRFNMLAASHGIPLYQYAETPIFYVYVGDTDAAYTLAGRMLESGIYANIAAFPSVPRNQAGLRLTLTRHLLLQDIDWAVAAIAEELEAILHTQGSSLRALTDELAAA